MRWTGAWSCELRSLSPCVATKIRPGAVPRGDGRCQSVGGAVADCGENGRALKPAKRLESVVADLVKVKAAKTPFGGSGIGSTSSVPCCGLKTGQNAVCPGESHVTHETNFQSKASEQSCARFGSGRAVIDAGERSVRSSRADSEYAGAKRSSDSGNYAPRG